MNTTIKLHKDLSTSDFKKYFNVKTADANKLHKYLGKLVQYKKWNPSLGSIAKTEKYKVGGFQYNFKGELCLRVYCTSFNDTFGRVMGLKEFKVVK